MKIIDFQNQIPTSQPQTNLSLELITAGLIFVLPAIILFVLVK